MDYVIADGEHSAPIALTPLGGDVYQFEQDGMLWTAEVERVAPNRLLVTLVEHGGVRFCVWTDRGRTTVEGFEFVAEAIDLRTQALRENQARHRATGPQLIQTPMPGRVAAILVEEGQTVAEGDGLVVVEAMKMENELKAPRAGVVRNLALTVGSQVSGGAILCSVH